MHSFNEFASRPDPKQEHIDVWQKEFNSMEPDLRFDEEIQIELHKRLSDLIDQLTDISDCRKKVCPCG